MTTNPGAEPGSRADEELGGRLAARLSEVLARPVPVTGLRRLSGGASRETWAFEADGRPLILRRDPPAAPRPAEMAREAAVLTAAAAGQVLVPRLVDHGDGAGTIGSPYLVMERLDGETIPRRLLRDTRFAEIRPRLAYELGRVLAGIHALPPAAVPGLPAGDPLADLNELYESFGEPRPAFELATRWLAANRPPAGGDGIVHGDFRNGNLMITPEGVRGVLDWELVHRGDPAEDLGWLCVRAWRFGSAAPVGGFGSRADLLAGYRAGGGVPPEPAALHWWEVYGTLRWGVLCRHQAERHLSGEDPSIELAALGRRVCEQEYDLLVILGLTKPIRQPRAPADADPPVLPEGMAPHDRPGPHALLAAVRDFLIDHVAAEGDERLRFHARVAASVLGVAQRELLLGEAHQTAHRERLAGLGCADDAELSRRIREGGLDDRFDEVVAVVCAAVLDKLAVADPRHHTRPVSARAIDPGALDTPGTAGPGVPAAP